MAALQPHVGGQPTPPIDFSAKSFANALLSHPTGPDVPQSPDHTTAGSHKGFPSIAFTDTHMGNLSKSFSWSLIAKFSKGYNKKDPKLGRPSVEDLQKFLSAMDFKQPFSLGLLDNRHAILHFRCEEDYLRLYSRGVWHVGAVTMRIFKWTPYFRVDKESSVVPIWISFPRLPLQFFQKEALFPISQLLGQPLRMDAATATLKRPSVARVQVELDILQPRPDKIWIQMGSQEGYWQKVVYDHVPSYCRNCWHVGHGEDDCHVNRLDARTAPKPQATAAGGPTRQDSQKQVYVAKTKVLSDGSFQHEAPVTVSVPSVSAELVPHKVPDQAPSQPIAPPTSQSVPPLQATVQPLPEPSLDLVDIPVTDFLVSKEIGFPAQTIAEVEASDTDEEISIHDGMDFEGTISDFAPLTFDIRVRDDLCVKPKALLPLDSRSAIPKAPLLATRAEVFNDLRAFGHTLQSRSLLTFDEDPSVADIVAHPRKRGRPRRDASLQLVPFVDPTPTHSMVTRSIASASLVLND